MITHKFGIDYSISFKRVDSSDAEILSEFKCEYPAITEFIHHEAVKSAKDVSYIFIDNENKTVIAFCSICCTGISTTASDAYGMAYNSTIPSVEIDFFAVDEKYRSLPLDKESTRYETLSSALFLYMINHIKTITKSVIGATHICLYAVPKAKSFYKRCDFIEFEDYMNRDEKKFVKDCIPMFYVI